MKSCISALFLLVLLGSSVNIAAACNVEVSHDPVVLRLGKDEFRIAFGVNGDACRKVGCNGLIRYQVVWQTPDGFTNVDRKLVSYQIPGGVSRSLTVDRQYFDTGESQHVTNITGVKVQKVSCSLL